MINPHDRQVYVAHKNGKGTIADFISDDLKSWEDNGVFMNMMWNRFYECPDVFKMGDWWYLVYSDKTSFMRKVQYFKGRTLDELKACTANDAGIWPDDHEGNYGKGLSRDYGSVPAVSGCSACFQPDYRYFVCAGRSNDSAELMLKALGNCFPVKE